MSNTITNLIPDIIKAWEIASREKPNLINAVSKNASASKAAKNETVRSPVAPENSTYDVTPSMTPLAAADMAYTNRDITLDTEKGYKFHFESEEQMGLRGSGAYDTMFQQNVANSYKKICADVSTAVAALYYNASRAYGTAGTTPFATDLSPLNAAKTILDRNGAPDDRYCILDYNAAFNFTNLTQNTNVNQAGSDVTRRTGEMLPTHGFRVMQDGNVPTHTVGTSVNQDVNGGDAIGTTSITYHGGDGGTILVGDTVSISGDTSGPGGTVSRYVVNTAITAAAGEIVINSPGLISAWGDTTEIALGSTDYVANLAFSSDAFQLGARAPQGDDSAIDETIIVDPMTGLPFRFAVYKGYRVTNYEVSLLFGVGKGNPAHAAIIMG